MAKTYTQLMETVISQFDRIYDTLRDKKVFKNGALLPDEYIGTPTSEYAGLISGQLVAIAKYNEAGTMVGTVSASQITGGILTDYSEVTKTNALAATLESLTPTTGSTTSYTIVANGLSEGYYKGTSHIYTTINVENPTFAPGGGNVSNITGTVNEKTVVTGYLLTPTEGKLISSVTVAKGSVNVSIDESDANQFKITSNYGVTDTVADTSLLVSKTNDWGTSDAVSFTVNRVVNRTGSIVVNPHVAKAAGYITDGDVVSAGIDHNLESNIEVDSQTFYIKKGTLTDIALPSDVTATISGTGLLLEDEIAETDANKYIEITSSIKSGNSETLAVTGKLSPGYIAPSETDGSISLGSVKIDAGTVYLKKGSVTNITGDAGVVPLKLTQDAGIAISETRDTTKEQYTVTVKVGATGAGTSLEGEVDPGYISATGYSATVTGETSLYINKGGVTLNPSASVAAPTGDTSILTSDTTDVYTVNVAPVIDMTGMESSAGYITSAEILPGTKSETGRNISIKKGRFTIDSGLDIDLVPGEADDGAHAGKDSNDQVIDIFENTVPTITKDGVTKTVDHYKFTASSSLGVNSSNEGSRAGYTKTTDIGFNGAQYKYLRKADVKWVTVTNDDGSTSGYLNVERGGYLPSGLISTIDSDASPTPAELVLAKSTTSSAIFKTGTASDTSYVLEIAKSAQTKAGYISASEGSVEGTFFVDRGGVGLSNGLEVTTTGLTPAAVTAEVEGKTVTTGYKLTVPVKATATLDITDGYVEGSNVTLNEEVYDADDNNTVVAETNAEISLTKAVIETKSGTQAISLAVTPEGITPLGKNEDGSLITSKYSVTPTITGNSKITIATTTPGYLSTSDETEITVISSTQGAVEPIYIAAGKPATIVETENTTNDVTATIDFSKAVTPEGSTIAKYVGTIAGNISAHVELAEGYYKSTEERNITNNISIEGVSFEVAKGSFEITNTVTPNITTATQNVFVSKGSDEGDDAYIAITTQTTVESSKTTDVPGYTKTEDVTIVNNTAAETFKETTKYIKKVTIANNTVAQTAGPADISAAAVAAASSINIPVANQFATADITATIHADAMGSSVAYRLRELEARLDGVAFTETLA